jgi:hypothetical protein
MTAGHDGDPAQRAHAAIAAGDWTARPQSVELRDGQVYRWNA